MYPRNHHPIRPFKPTHPILNRPNQVPPARGGSLSPSQAMRSPLHNLPTKGNRAWQRCTHNEPPRGFHCIMWHVPAAHNPHRRIANPSAHTQSSVHMHINHLHKNCSKHPKCTSTQRLTAGTGGHGGGAPALSSISSQVLASVAHASGPRPTHCAVPSSRLQPTQSRPSKHTRRLRTPNTLPLRPPPSPYRTPSPSPPTSGTARARTSTMCR